jgi:hypothetical protein
MRRSRAFWLLACLCASCAVRGFTIQDELPDGSGSSGASSVGGSQSGSGASQSEGGQGVAGSMAQGGKVGTAGTAGTGGSQSEAGTPSVDGGQPSVGNGGDGAGGAPPNTTTAPCDQVNGQPPILCDDFESGGFAPEKWTPPAGLGVIAGEGPHGTTQLVHLDTAPLQAKVADLPITDAAGPVTVSFWLKAVMFVAGANVVSFRDRSAAASTLRLSGVEKELGWRSSTSNFFVPQAPTADQLLPGTWTCVSITLRTNSLELRYQAEGFAPSTTLIADSEPTPNVDVNWSNMPADNRFVSGYPAFAGAVNGVPSEIMIDDVRIVQGTSNVCGL